MGNVRQGQHTQVLLSHTPVPLPSESGRIGSGEIVSVSLVKVAGIAKGSQIC